MSSDATVVKNSLTHCLLVWVFIILGEKPNCAGPSISWTIGNTVTLTRFVMFGIFFAHSYNGCFDDTKVVEVVARLHKFEG